MKVLTKGLVSAVMAMGLFSLVACGGNKSSKASKVINVMVEVEVQSLDPQEATDGTSFEVIANFTDGLKQMNADGVASCIKHYPGYGNNIDTHTNVARDKRSLKTFKKRDLVPFSAGMKNDCSMVMINHNIVYAFDRKLPASISPKVHSYIRKTLKYDGIIITDGMGMVGVRKYGKSNAALAVKAINAGNDMLCTPYGKTSRNAIVKAVKSGKIKKERINRSVERILILKLKKGIIK